MNKIVIDTAKEAFAFLIWYQKNYNDELKERYMEFYNSGGGGLE